MEKWIRCFWEFTMFCFCCTIGMAKEVNLESPYYMYPRENNQHIDLSSDWNLSSEIVPIDDLMSLDDNSWFNVAYPTSVQMAHYKAGILGDPYKHLNAREHEKLEQKVWYYKKEFDLFSKKEGYSYILNFDGIDYFAKVWLNGKLLGKHRGIFGGPTVDVSEELIYNGKNELIVEVLSANYGQKSFNPNKPGKIVKGWFLMGGSAMEPFFNLGLWRNVRIEVIPKYHIERPFLYTEKIVDGQATIGCKVELFAGTNSLDYSLHPWDNRQISNYSNPFDAPQRKLVKEELKLIVELIRDGRVSYSQEFTPEVIEGRSWLERHFVIDNPKLWYPNGLGDPDYYLAKLTLKVNGNPIDCIQFDFGIRTIEQRRSAGIRTSDRWQDWQFIVNGIPFFVKGLNWMPVDALYDLTADKYDWAVKMAKNLGVQMFRIWGSGLLESDAFYSACNKYGIMVWQDFNIANFDTPEWPQEVWEAQVCQNIFRLRNQPSLAVWCGGNEFNPYSYGNAASMGILERNLSIFDPTRAFLRTSPDAGSMHSYPDFDPSWYKGFNLIPFVSETGIHCITDPDNIRQVVDPKELYDLSGMYEDDFRETHPEFVEHFAEYNPSRVPRMLSRASHIDNIAKPTLDMISEATQVGAGEFYQVMSEGIQSNYPVTTGLMPWVYKRPWPVVAGINLVDGMGQPSATYYFLKKTYESTHVLLDIERLLWAPGDTFPISVNILNGVGQLGFEGVIDVKILDDSFKEVWHDLKVVDVSEGTSVLKTKFGNYIIPQSYKEKFFFVVVSLNDKQGKVISRSEYWPRTIKFMEDSEYRQEYILKPVEWPTLFKGPWLKPTVKNRQTDIDLFDVRLVSRGKNEGHLKMKIINKGIYPSFMTQLDIEGSTCIFYASDNFFWLSPNEVKEVDLYFKFQEQHNSESFSVSLKSWNAEEEKQSVNLVAENLESIPNLVAYWDFGTEKVFDVLASKGVNKWVLEPSDRDATKVVEEGPLSGYSLCFDGTNYLSIPYEKTGRLNVQTNAVTVIAWVKWTGEQTGFIGGMWNEYQDGGKRQYGLFVSLPYYNGADQVCGHISQTGKPTPPFPYSIDYSASKQKVPKNEWCCVAFTYDGQYIRSFLNGKFEEREIELIEHTKGFEGYPNGLIQSKNPYYYPDGIGDNGSDFTIGAVLLKNGMGNFFKGLLGGLAIYDRALTPQEIERISQMF